MKIVPRAIFWLGVISIAYGIILKIFGQFGTVLAWPFGLLPGSFLRFSTLCFIAAIAYSVVYIFQKQSE